jgi:hypothetical protein
MPFFSFKDQSVIEPIPTGRSGASGRASASARDL